LNIRPVSRQLLLVPGTDGSDCTSCDFPGCFEVGHPHEADPDDPDTNWHDRLLSELVLINPSSQSVDQLLRSSREAAR
jgi:hypothetical protein